LIGKLVSYVIAELVLIFFYPVFEKFGSQTSVMGGVHYLDEPIPYLPAEDPGIAFLIIVDPPLNLRSGDPWLGSSDHSWPD